LDVGAIVPGHAAVTTGAAIAVYKEYLDDVQASAARVVRDRVPADEFVAAATVPERFRIAAPLIPLMTGFHRWNLQRAIREAQAKQQ
jgi:hypothetical protein